MIEVQPGDILLVRNQSTAPLTRMARWAIQLGAWLEGASTTWTHVIVAHHEDDSGIFWGLEGRPGTVGWCELAPHLADPVTLTNVHQGKTNAQRALICDAMLPLIGVAGYDWAAIAADAGIALAAAAHVAPAWSSLDPWGPRVPGHVVCSSLADFAYERAGLESPAADRFCTPGDWARLIKDRGWS
jgi:hypothetical protein